MDRLSPFDIESIEDEVMSEYGHEHPLRKFSLTPGSRASEATLRRQRAMVFERLLSASEDQAFQVFRLLSEGFSVEEALERADLRKNPSSRRPARGLARRQPRSLERAANQVIEIEGKPVRVLGSTRFKGGFGAVGLKSLVTFQGSQYEVSTIEERGRFQTIVYSADGEQLVVEEDPEGSTLEDAHGWSFRLLPLAAQAEHDGGDIIDMGGRENPERKPSKVQSVLIPKDRYTLREARKWIKEHKFVDKGVDETDRYYRFRQFAPTKHYAYRTIAFGQSGIKAVLRVSKKPRD